ncbi:TetR/AcrR family transcriptional regulator [Salicibibacter cibi]|uniref:TetR/AcrR family transcriptional regulator n=1 Tax=Salicibibacter cibi TaxID=2743001 RepID=A0A7T6ZB89_9BACI|nr:TetR/AcrR family transcriptional regulator [Salicibibacter cibi]QQK80080.1 TetR/AcrR family transcriptional regulator [Salicibibacter cibi]
MNETFKNLEETKQKRILSAAMKEFADKGYEQASTNQIIKDAGIGKGTLFHYFNNKKDLYEYLVDYAITIMHDEYFSLIDTSESDFIERMKQIAQVKGNYIAEHPNVTNFIGMVYLNDEVTLPKELETRLADLKKTGYSLIYKNINQKMLRRDINTDKALKLIQWSIEGYQNELMRLFQGEKIAHIDLQPYWDEFYEYLDVLKTTFYEEGQT